MSVPRPDTSSWLVATKLQTPRLRTDIVRRPRLEDELGQSVRAQLVTLVSAPAGYGKTTLLAMLPQLLSDLPLAWVSLESDDSDPVRFIGLLVTALQGLAPDCGRATWGWLASGTDSTDLKRAMAALIDDIARSLPQPFLLVLDDLHYLTETAVYEVLEYLIEHQPPQLHLVIGTRQDPPLRLARLAAQRQLAEFRLPQLAFSLSEATQLVSQTLQLDLSESEIAALQDRTEGWPAGICLLAGPLRRLPEAGRAQFMASLSASEQPALDFLAEEVLRGLPADMRRFLLQTSVLPEMTPSACRAVTGRDDAGELLERLYRQNLTIALIGSGDGDESVYRHHALFARLLARQLSRELPGELAELQHRAARAQKTPARAVTQYLAAGLWEAATQLIDQTGMQLLSQGLTETVLGWCALLPDETLSDHPELFVLLARCGIHRGDYAEAAVLLNRAYQAFIARGDAVGESHAVASLITLAYQDNDRAAAQRLVDCASFLPLDPLGRTAAGLARAWLALGSGRWEVCEQSIHAALAVPRETGDVRADFTGITYLSAPLMAIPGCLEAAESYLAEAGQRARPDTAWRAGALEMAAWPQLWRGRIAEAQSSVEAANTLREQLGGYPFIGNDAAVQSVVLATASGDTAGANQAVDRLLERIDRAARGKWSFYLHAAGRGLALLGRQAEADVVRQRLVALGDTTPLTRYLLAHLTSLLALGSGRLSDDRELVELGLRLEDDLPIAWVGGSVRLLVAAALVAKNEADQALTTMAPLLDRWESLGLPGCSLLDGPVALPALRLAAEHGSVTAQAALRPFLPGPGVGVEPVGVAPAGLVQDPLAGRLSSREIEVLRLICLGHTNREIAHALYVSEETVKSHVVHILRKLDVSSRTQAALRARELGYGAY